MKQAKRLSPPIRLLRYKKDDLIIKEGDYGTTIYKILKGRVKIFSESGNREVVLATMGPGEIIGEMIFLKGTIEPRTASVRALEDCELEAWHFERVRKEYTEMPTVIKCMVDQALDRLVRINKILIKMDIQRQMKAQQKPRDPLTPQRHYYRKEVDLECIYRPFKASSKVSFGGRVKDISMNGLGIEIAKVNTAKFPHETGQVFIINTTLPNGRPFNVKAVLATVTRHKSPGILTLGMSFIEMTLDLQKRLGFFLLP